MGALCGEGRVCSGEPTPCRGRWGTLDCEPGGSAIRDPGELLVDFFHVCEYLGEAAPVCAPDHPQAWLDVQKERLKANQATAVLDALAPFVRADENDNPVTACDRYLRHRLDHLDDQGAIQQGLPIGSGEIESAHRYIIQERLKLPGAWWLPDHVKTMLALRLNRANREWEAYWQRAEKEAAEPVNPPLHHFESHPSLEGKRAGFNRNLYRRGNATGEDGSLSPKGQVFIGGRGRETVNTEMGG